MTACRIVGPYLPVGDVDWCCETHGTVCVLRDPERWRAKGLSREDFVCPREGKSAWCPLVVS